MSNQNDQTSEEPPKDIRITDAYVRALVEAERKRRKDSTATKTAARLIVERLAQLELQTEPSAA